MTIVVGDGITLRCPSCGNEDGITVLEMWGSHVRLQCHKCGFEGSNNDIPAPKEEEIKKMFADRIAQFFQNRRK